MFERELCCCRKHKKDAESLIVDELLFLNSVEEI